MPSLQDVHVQTADRDAETLFAGSGEMRARCRALDWATTPLGAVSEWPASLRTAVDICLGATVPSFVWWGPDLIQIYNDAALAITRAKHPAALGAPARVAWADVWPAVGALLQGVFTTGEAVRCDDMPMVLERGGAHETAWFTFSYSAVRDERGDVAGVYSSALETTNRMRAEAALRAGEERQAFLLKFPDALRAEPSADAVAHRAIQMLVEEMGLDRCYITVYRPADDRADFPYQVGNDRIPPLPDTVRLSDFPDAFQQVLRKTVVIEDDFERQQLSEAERRNSRGLGMRALLASTLRKGENNPLSSIAAASASPRCWTPGEIALVEEVAERTWAAMERARAEAALRESEERYRTLFAAIDEGFVLCRLLRDGNGAASDYRILDVNPAYERQTGTKAIDAVGRLRAEFDPIHNDRTLALCARAVDTGEPVRFEYFNEALNRWFDVGVIPRAGDQFAAVFTNITERKRAHDALRESETRYRALIENVRDYAIYLLDPDGIITEWTPGAEHVKGFTASEALGRHVGMFYPENDRIGGVPEHELAVAAEQGRLENEGWRVRKNGDRFWADEIITAVHDARGGLVGFAKICRDLTHRMLVESAVDHQRQHREREGFRRELALVEENERRRLARELHDQLGQHLAAITLGLDEARRMVSEGASERGALRTAARLRALQELAAELTTAARNLALELRPAELDDVGLESALETYVTRWAARTHVRADVEIAGPGVVPHAPEVSNAIYRITQEALTNTSKHADAQHVSVIVERADGAVRLIVEDDGCGFDTNVLAARPSADRGLGLAGMRERAALAGGLVTVESAPGSGTTIYVTFPSTASRSAHST